MSTGSFGVECITNGCQSINGSDPGMTSTLSLLMDKIRSRAATSKVWPEIVKLTKATFSENKSRSGLLTDPIERSQIERALDTIQKSIKVKDTKSMLERLETISRSLKLKFMPGPTGHRECFISSDMFYVEVVLNPNNGYVTDVKIAHQSDPISCQELINVLRNGDFDTFTSHLEGIASIYNLVADKKTKTKVYMALHSLEQDLSVLAQIQHVTSNDPGNIIHKTPVGILEPRKGGHSMKLTFFVSPYDLIDRKSKSSVPLSIDTVVDRKLGYSGTICIESTISERNHKLQTTSLITVSKSHDGKNLPQFAALSNLNSSTLPACFVLKLPKPMAVSIELLRKISLVTGIDLTSAASSAGQPNNQPQLLINLIAMSVLPESERTKLKDMMSRNSGLNVSTNQNPKCYFAKLPDQEHCYYLSMNGFNNLQGMAISAIPFTHPTHVPQILVFLRQQCLFNVIIGSCIRKLSSFGKTGLKIIPAQASTPKYTFELAYQSMASVNITFEHPVDESLASLEIDMKEITNVKCKLYSAPNCAWSLSEKLISEDYVTKVMQRSLSIPITLRMILLKATEKYQRLKEADAIKQATREKERSNAHSVSGGSLTTSGVPSDANDFSSFMANYNSAKLQPKVSPIPTTTPPVSNLHPTPAAESNPTPISPMVQLMTNLQAQQQLLKAAMASAEVATQTGNMAIATSLAAEIQTRQRMVQTLLNQIAKQRATEIARAQQQASIGKGAPSGTLNKQQTASALKAQANNAMLLNMLQDLPSAGNPTLQQQVQLYNLYQQKVQQLDQESKAQQQSQLFQGQQQQPVKKTRKRRNAASDATDSAVKVSRGGKRKMSDANSAEGEIFSADYTSAAQSLPGSKQYGGTMRPASSALSSFHGGVYSGSNTPPASASHRGSAQFERQRSLDEILSMSGSKDNVSDSVMSLLQRSLSASATHLASDDSITTIPVARKRTGRLRSSDDAIQSSSFEDPFAVDTSDASYHGYHQVTRPSSVGPQVGSTPPMGKGRQSSDGRRCSSAGIGEPVRVPDSEIDDPASSLLSPLIGTASIKKEKKRKRSESVDSIKSNVTSSGSCPTTSGLMPPPLVTSSGEATSGSRSPVTSPNVYKFSDTIGSPLSAARSLSLNVSKSGLLPTSTSGSSPNKQQLGVLGKKLSLVSSTGLVSGQNRTKNEAKLKILKGMMDMVSSGHHGMLPESPNVPGGSSLMAVGRVSTASNPRQATPKYIKSTGAGGPKSAAAGSSGRFKSPQGHVSSSSSPSLSSKSHFSIGMQLTSPPVSSSSVSASCGLASSPSSMSPASSSSILASPPVTSGSVPDFGVSSSKVPSSPVSGSQGGTKGVGKRTLGSLASVIDKLASKSGATTTSAAPSAQSSSAATGSSDLPSAALAPDSIALPSSPNPGDADSSSRTGSIKPGAKARPGTVGGAESSSFKASISGSGKLTISKTKPVADTSKPSGPRMKIGTGMKSLATSSTTGPKMKIGTGMVKRVGQGIKKGQSSSVISSSSSSAGGSLLSPSPKPSTAPSKSSVRPSGSKVSSSGSGSRSSDISSSGLGAILKEALPRLRLDQLPKIPKTPASVAAAAAAAAAAEAAKNAPPPPPVVLPLTASSSTSMGPPQSMASSSQPSIQPQQHGFQQRRLSREQQQPGHSYQPLNRDANSGPFAPPSSTNTQLDPRMESASDSRTLGVLGDRFQSNAITSSQVNWSSTKIGNQETSAATSSTTPSVGRNFVASESRPGVTSASCDTSSDTNTTSSSTEPKPSHGQVRPPIDGPEEPTSTPSSPVESASGDMGIAPPPIIPIDPFENESDRGHGDDDDDDGEASPSLMISDVIDSSDNVSSPGITGGPSTTSTTTTTSAISSSISRPTPSKDEEDDADDGLVIDDAEPSTPKLSSGHQESSPTTTEDADSEITTSSSCKVSPKASPKTTANASSRTPNVSSRKNSLLSEIGPSSPTGSGIVEASSEVSSEVTSGQNKSNNSSRSNSGNTTPIISSPSIMPSSGGNRFSWPSSSSSNRVSVSEGIKESSTEESAVTGSGPLVPYDDEEDDEDDVPSSAPQGTSVRRSSDVEAVASSKEGDDETSEEPKDEDLMDEALVTRM